MRQIDLVRFFNAKIKETAQFNPDSQLLESERKLARSILVRTLNKFAASNDVGGVEVAATLLGHPDHYCGSNFVVINWKGWDAAVCQGLGSAYSLHTYRFSDNHGCGYYKILKDQGALEMNIPLEDQFSLEDFKQEYLHRSEKLEEECIYSMAAKFRFGRFKRNDDDSLEVYEILDEGFDVDYVVGHMKMRRKVVPSLIWFSPTSKIHGTTTEAYARVMVTLFKPFRIWTDLLDGFGSFKDALNALVSNGDSTKYPYSVLSNLLKNGHSAKEAETNREQKPCSKSIS